MHFFQNVFYNIHLSVGSQSCTGWKAGGEIRGFTGKVNIWRGSRGNKRKLQVENECVYAFKLLVPFKYQILWIMHIEGHFSWKDDKMF